LHSIFIWFHLKAKYTYAYWIEWSKPRQA